MRYELHDKENDGAEYKHVDYDVGLQGMELVVSLQLLSLHLLANVFQVKRL